MNTHTCAIRVNIMPVNVVTLNQFLAKTFKTLAPSMALI